MLLVNRRAWRGAKRTNIGTCRMDQVLQKNELIKFSQYTLLPKQARVYSRCFVENEPLVESAPYLLSYN